MAQVNPSNLYQTPNSTSSQITFFNLNAHRISTNTTNTRTFGTTNHRLPPHSQCFTQQNPLLWLHLSGPPVQPTESQPSQSPRHARCQSDQPHQHRRHATLIHTRRPPPCHRQRHNPLRPPKRQARQYRTPCTTITTPVARAAKRTGRR